MSNSNQTQSCEALVASLTKTLQSIETTLKRKREEQENHSNKLAGIKEQFDRQNKLYSMNVKLYDKMCDKYRLKYSRNDNNRQINEDDVTLQDDGVIDLTKEDFSQQIYYQLPPISYTLAELKTYASHTFLLDPEFLNNIHISNRHEVVDYVSQLHRYKILCPYDLVGKCSDPDCNYWHLQERSNISNGQKCKFHLPSIVTKVDEIVTVEDLIQELENDVSDDSEENDMDNVDDKDDNLKLVIDINSFPDISSTLVESDFVEMPKIEDLPKKAIRSVEKNQEKKETKEKKIKHLKDVLDVRSNFLKYAIDISKKWFVFPEEKKFRYALLQMILHFGYTDLFCSDSRNKSLINAVNIRIRDIIQNEELFEEKENCDNEYHDIVSTDQKLRYLFELHKKIIFLQNPIWFRSYQTYKKETDLEHCKLHDIVEIFYRDPSHSFVNVVETLFFFYKASKGKEIIGSIKNLYYLEDFYLNSLMHVTHIRKLALVPLFALHVAFMYTAVSPPDTSFLQKLLKSGRPFSQSSLLLQQSLVLAENDMDLCKYVQDIGVCMIHLQDKDR